MASLQAPRTPTCMTSSRELPPHWLHIAHRSTRPSLRTQLLWKVCNLHLPNSILLLIPTSRITSIDHKDDKATINFEKSSAAKTALMVRFPAFSIQRYFNMHSTVERRHS